VYHFFECLSTFYIENSTLKSSGYLELTFTNEDAAVLANMSAVPFHSLSIQSNFRESKCKAKSWIIGIIFVNLMFFTFALPFTWLASS